jgi:hypothetical protein
MAIADTAGHRKAEAPAHQAPLWKLYLLRLLYAAIGILMGAQIWPIVFQHGQLRLMDGIAIAMLAALTAMCLLGIRYPLQMLPIMFFEFLWKATWLFGFALPEALKGPLPADMMRSFYEIAPGMIIPFIIPWRYVFENYVKRRGDRWW